MRETRYDRLLTRFGFMDKIPIKDAILSVCYITKYVNVELLVEAGIADKETIGTALRSLSRKGSPLLSKLKIAVRQELGSNQYAMRDVYTLTAQGREWAIDLMDLEYPHWIETEDTIYHEFIHCLGKYINTKNPLSSKKAYHTLATLSYLVGAAGNEEIADLEFYHERFFDNLNVSSAGFCPDASCKASSPVLQGEVVQPVFVELDMGTEHSKAIREKLLNYHSVFCNNDILYSTMQICFVLDGTKYQKGTSIYTYQAITRVKHEFPLDVSTLPEKQQEIIGTYTDSTLLSETDFKEVTKKALAADRANQQAYHKRESEAYYRKRKQSIFSALLTEDTIINNMKKGLSIVCTPGENLKKNFRYVNPAFYTNINIMDFICYLFDLNEDVSEQFSYYQTLLVGDCMMKNIYAYDDCLCMIENISDDLGGRVRCRHLLEHGITERISSHYQLVMLVESEEDARTFLNSFKPIMDEEEYCFVLYDDFDDTQLGIYELIEPYRADQL